MHPLPEGWHGGMHLHKVPHILTTYSYILLFILLYSLPEGRHGGMHLHKVPHILTTYSYILLYILLYPLPEGRHGGMHLHEVPHILNVYSYVYQYTHYQRSRIEVCAVIRCYTHSLDAVLLCVRHDSLMCET